MLKVAKEYFLKVFEVNENIFYKVATSCVEEGGLENPMSDVLIELKEIDTTLKKINKHMSLNFEVVIA